MEWLTQLLPGWLLEWLQIYVAPFFKLQMRALLRALMWGVTETIVFIGLPITLSIGSQAVWNARYQLSMAQQEQVEAWASISRLIAYIEDVPPVVPLVLWFKEGGVSAENPNNCEGIMGLHTAVTTGALPCFPAGPVTPREIAYQLQLGTRTFKEYCPEITYTTTDPTVIKRCYLRYNAGPASQSDPNQSAYVMNGYDAKHQNMILTDVRGQQYRMTALGAWPAHIAIQTQLAQRQQPAAPAALLAPAMLIQEFLDKVWVLREDMPAPTADVVLDPEAEAQMCRVPEVRDCFIEPHTQGDAALRPAESPLLIAPVESGELACGLLPGVDLIPPKPSVALAPMLGDLTRYADGMGHLAVQIENEEWTVWVTGLRSYIAAQGKIEVGHPIGAIGGAESRTPSVHYAIYDKINAGFVDPLSFVPADMCPPAD